MKNYSSSLIVIYLIILSIFLIQIPGFDETEAEATITQIDESIPHKKEITIPITDISKETDRYKIFA